MDLIWPTYIMINCYWQRRARNTITDTTCLYHRWIIMSLTKPDHHTRVSHMQKGKKKEKKRCLTALKTKFLSQFCDSLSDRVQQEYVVFYPRSKQFWSVHNEDFCSPFFLLLISSLAISGRAQVDKGNVTDVCAPIRIQQHLNQRMIFFDYLLVSHY